MPAAAMLTRQIPSTGEAIPVIGLGTWRAFDVGTDEATRRPLREAMRLFLDTGGRMIDSELRGSSAICWLNCLGIRARF